MSFWSGGRGWVLLFLHKYGVFDVVVRSCCSLLHWRTCCNTWSLCQSAPSGMIIVFPGKVRLPHHGNSELDRTLQRIQRMEGLLWTLLLYSEWYTGYVGLLGFGGMCVLRGECRWGASWVALCMPPKYLQVGAASCSCRMQSSVRRRVHISADVRSFWCAGRETSVYSYKVVLEERAVKPVHSPRKRCHFSVPRCCCNNTRSIMASVSLQVKEVCTRGHKMVVAKRSDTIEMCVKKMIAADVRHLPVIDDHTGEVFGLISVKVSNRRTLLHTASVSPASVFREISPVPQFALFVWCSVGCFGF